MRAPLAALPGVLLAVFACLALPGLAGCRQQAAQVPAASGNATDATQGASAQSEAERTRAMEDKARELEKKAADIQSMEGTEQEKIDAVNKLEQERQEMNKTGGDGSAPPAPQQ